MIIGCLLAAEPVDLIHIRWGTTETLTQLLETGRCAQHVTHKQDPCLHQMFTGPVLLCIVVDHAHTV